MCICVSGSTAFDGNDMTDSSEKYNIIDCELAITCKFLSSHVIRKCSKRLHLHRYLGTIAVVQSL